MSDAQAVEFIDYWLAEAGSAAPEDAYALMTGAARDKVGRAQFVRGWRHVFWAERTSERERIKFNTFRVDFRQYIGDGLTDDANPSEGRIDTWTDEKMTLTWDEEVSAVRMSFYEFDLDESPPEPVNYPMLVLLEGSDAAVARRLPSRLSKNTGLTSWGSATPPTTG